MPTWMAALVLAVAIGATYVFCIRPMRRGECGAGAAGVAHDAEHAREIAELRDEIRILRAENDLERDQAQHPAGEHL